MADSETSTESPSPQGRGIPWYIDEGPVVLMDGAVPNPASWKGANDLALRLLRCLEPVRDLTEQLKVLRALPPEKRNPRLVKLLAVPLHNLIERTVAWTNALTITGDERLKGDAERKRVVALVDSMKSVGGIELASDGAKPDVTVVRDKIAAHIDADAVFQPEKYWAKVDLLSYISQASVLILVLHRLLALDGYAWSRLGSHEDVWDLMSVDGVLVSFATVEGKPGSILAVTDVESPKIAIERELLRLQTVCMDPWEGSDYRGMSDRPQTLP